MFRIWAGRPQRLRRVIAAAVVAGAAAASSGPSAAQVLPGPREGETMVEVLAAAEAHDWLGARRAAGALRTDAAQDVLLWLRLSLGDAGWAEYVAFMEANPGWPRQTLLRRRAERVMHSGLAPKRVIAFFDGAPPLTGFGALRLAEAYRALGDAEAAEATLVAAWRELELQPATEGLLLDAAGRALTPHHAARLDQLLWNNRRDAAARMLPRVSTGWRMLARTRTRLRRGQNGVDKLIKAVPKDLENDPGLAFERFRWRMRRDRYDEAETLLAERSVSAEALGRPEFWGDRRRILARRAMRQGRAQDAYRLASNHFIADGPDRSDLEWLSGYIALQHLKDPKRAKTHFERFAKAVETPISRGRAQYWLGRVAERLGDQTGAEAAYAAAAEHPTSFYGQQAALLLGVEAEIDAAPASSDWRRAPALRGDLVQAGMLFHRAGRERDARAFFLAAARSLTGRGDLVALGELMIELGRPDYAVRIAKTAARRGIVLPAQYYPLTQLAEFKGPLDPAIAMSVARQETEFKPNAVSHAGARGLMQVMPQTARIVAREIGVPYDRTRLTEDWRYNALLGQTYMAGLIEDFRGSLPLAAAGYNAGPHRVSQWIAAHGDPRSGAIDMVDWIEMIAFRETRNYVMRVMEGIEVYRARIPKKVANAHTAPEVTRDQRPDL